MAKNRRHDIVKSSKYKTLMCAFFVSPDGCPFGDQCAFAHGAGELRNEVENAKVKENLRKLDVGTVANLNNDNALSKKTGLPANTAKGGSESSVDHVLLSKIYNIDAGKFCKNVMASAKHDGAKVLLGELSRVKQIEPTTEKGIGKGVKPPPKITKGRHQKKALSVIKETGNRSESKEQKNNRVNNNVDHQPQGAEQNYPPLGSGFVEKVGEGNSLPQFSRPSVSPAPMQCVGSAPQFTPSHGPPPGASHVVCFSENRMQGTGDRLLTPFVSLSVTKTEGMRSPGMSIGGFIPLQQTNNSGGWNNYGQYYQHHHHYHHQHYHHRHHYHHHHQNHHFSEQSLGIISNSSPLLALMQIQSATTVTHDDSLWVSVPGCGLPSALPAEGNIQDDDKGGSCDRHDHDNSQSHPCCVPSACIEEDSTALVNAAEWHQFIEKWLESQVETGAGESASGGNNDAYSDSGEARFSPANCVSDRLEVGGQETAPAYAVSVKSPREEPATAIMDMVRNCSTWSSKEDCLEELVLSPGSNLKIQGGSISKVQMANEKLLDVNGGEGGESSSSSSRSSNSGDEGNKFGKYRLQNPFAGCQDCMSHPFRRHYPVVVNTFQSSCAAAARRIFLNCAEFHVVRSVEDGKDRVSPCASAKGFQETGSHLEYCI